MSADPVSAYIQDLVRPVVAELLQEKLLEVRDHLIREMIAIAADSSKATLKVDEDEFLTQEELSKRLKITKRSIRRWSNEGDLPMPVKVGTVLRYNWAEVLRAIDKSSSMGGAA